MKKILITIMMALFIFITGCSSVNSSTENTTEASSETTKNNYDPDFLVMEYCSDIWDGNFISEKFNCASIESGYLWVNCKNTYRIPDMGIYEDAYWAKVISRSDEGTWIHDTEIGTIELWHKGIRHKKIVLQTDAYYTSVYMISDGFVAHEGSTVCIYNIDGCLTEKYDNIIDCYQKATGHRVFISTFDNENFAIYATEEIVKLVSNDVRFPREQVRVNINNNSKSTLSKFMEFYNSEEWSDGKIALIDDNIVVIDYFGNIIINNKFAGNICIGSKLVPEATYGSNIYLDDETSYWLNGAELVKFHSNGEDEYIEFPYASTEFLWADEDNGIIVRTYDNKLFFIDTDNSVNLISDNTIDAYVAYKTLYFMEEDNTVYSLLWSEKGAIPEVFVKGAYAVSHHSDEAQGAIVPEKIANYDAYGYSNLYSPYGE